MEATEQIKVDPGVYNDIPDPDYRKWEGVSNSSLTDLLEWSPFHVDYWRRNPKPKTEALIVGAAFHCLVLRPDEFDKEFVRAEQCGAVKQDGQRCSNSGIVRSRGAWLCGVHSKKCTPDDMTGIEIISADQLKMIEAMRDAVMNHPAARQILTSEGQNEVSCRWDIDVDGKPLKAKGRLDGIRPSWNAVIDLKTTDCARRQDFEKKIGEYGYHRQGAYYIDGLNRAGYGTPINHFVLIAVEKQPPYGVAAFTLKGEALEAGREELRKPISLYANCQRNNYWPGYDSEFEDITIPAWKYREIIKAA